MICYRANLSIIQNTSFSQENTSSAQEIASFSQEIFVSPVFFPCDLCENLCDLCGKDNY
jgi:hypothetical protein